MPRFVSFLVRRESLGGGNIGKLGAARISCVAFVFCVGTAIAAPAQTFDTLLRFDYSNGALPCPNELVQGFDGNVYGTTQAGGDHLNPCQGGCGTVFRMTPTGQLTVLYDFCAQTGCPDGSSPTNLILAANGEFYGTTFYGGAAGDGTVFRITDAGKLTTLYSFCSLAYCADGIWPQGLVQAANGNFYGITQEGGSNGDGTVFEITPAGKLTTLYNFCSQTNCTDGRLPQILMQAANGNF